MLGSAIIKYLSQLVLSGGDHDGSLFRVLPWGKEISLTARLRWKARRQSVSQEKWKIRASGRHRSGGVDPTGPLHGEPARSGCDCVQLRTVADNL